MRGQKQAVVAAMAVAVLGGIATSAQAALVNGGFEDGLTNWTSVIGGRPDASASAVDNVANQSNAFPDFADPLVAPADGTHYAFVSFSSVYQDIGQLLPNTNYTLTVAIGIDKYTGTTGNPGSISLLNGTDHSGTPLSSVSAIDTTSFVKTTGGFVDLTTTYQTGANVSGNLVVMISAPDGWWNGRDKILYADNVRLTAAAAVPEPTSLAILGLGGLGLLARRRRHA